MEHSIRSASDRYRVRVALAWVEQVALAGEDLERITTERCDHQAGHRVDLLYRAAASQVGSRVDRRRHARFRGELQIAAPPIVALDQVLEPVCPSVAERNATLWYAAFRAGDAEREIGLAVCSCRIGQPAPSVAAAESISAHSRTCAELRATWCAVA